MALGSISRRWAAAAATVGLVVVGALAAQPAVADTAPVNPTNPATPPTVSADALPTVQVDGVVWSQVVVGRTVYVAGQFTTARPAGSAPGVNTVPRQNLLAFDIETGALVQSFAPALDAQALSITASPDGKRVYVVGDFNKVTEPGKTAQWRVRAAAFDTATGALVPTFRPTLSARALTVAASNDTVYVGGNFASAASVTGGTLQPRAYLAAFKASDGALTPFVADANAPVTALARTFDGGKLVVGGRFTQLSGAAVYGLGAVSPTSGALSTFPANSVIRNAGNNSSITSLYADASGVYGTGYHFGSGGNLEGTFRADASTGSLIWVADCHGDAYSAFPVGNEVYTASHHHYCGNMGGFLQTEPWSFYRGNAFSKAATGTNTADIYGYPDFRNRPAPSMLAWYPDIPAGTYTGQNQGGWSVTGNDRYVVMGGEFPRVNGAAQQGLVRFARPDIAPKKMGPRLRSVAFEPRAQSVVAGDVRVTWRGNEDPDNDTLVYRLYREGTAAPIHEQTMTTPFWRNPAMSFTDTGRQAGATHRYRVTATDPHGNTAESSWVSVTVASASTARPYVAQVVADGATSFWRLGDTPGTTARDSAGFWDGVLATAPVGATPGPWGRSSGAIGGDPDSATVFSGGTGSSGSFITSKVPVQAPNTFSVEAWFRTTTATGGKIVGMGSSSLENSRNYDRHVYMDDAGRLHFGVNGNGQKTVDSTASYNDGQWHHVVGTLGSNGLRLWVDGVLVGQRTDTTTGQRYSGYWRIGGDNVGTSWTASPTTKYFQGTIDEVAVYPSVLGEATIKAHSAARDAAPPPPPPANVAPTASFTATTADLAVSVDGSGSTDSDGTIASYAWNFGNGATGTGKTASHAYAAAGTYTITLTVTDNAGATGKATRSVTVTAPTTPPPTTDLAADTFERAVTGGWGSAQTGGAWTQSGTAAAFSVASGTGRHALGAGTTLSSYLGSVSSTSTDLQFTVALDKPATGGGVYLTAFGRRVGTADYRVRVKVPATGALHLQVGQGATTVLNAATLTGMTYAPGERLQVRLQVTGTGTSTVRAKVWKVGTTEPTAWQVSATDTTAALQTAGSIGLSSYLSGSATNAPITVTYDDLRATPAG